MSFLIDAIIAQNSYGFVLIMHNMKLIEMSFINATELKILPTKMVINVLSDLIDS